MRTFLGYTLTILLLPILSLFAFLFYAEYTDFERFDDVLDAKIPVEEIELPQTSYITSGNGTIISEITHSEDRIYLQDEDIPEFIKQLFIVAEDRNFYEHIGFDAVAISRALLANHESDSIEQGGSTITQQLARNLYLTTEKTYNRKLAELLYSYQLERTLDKKKILELYVNSIYFQNGVYGIEAASRFYFSRPAGELSQAELAFLAAIPNNPSLYNPLKHFENTKSRQERLLRQMVDEHQLSEAEFANIRDEPITLKVRSYMNAYPDYVSYVQNEFKRLVASAEKIDGDLKSDSQSIKEAAEKKLNEKVKHLLQSGIVIQTALDINIQNRSQQALRNQLKNTEAEGATVVIQHHTHQLVSLIGGKNYKKNSFNRAYQSYRQPGSALKPLLVYAPYIEETGDTLTSTVSGAKFCKAGYCPENYGGANYGMVTLKKAFAKSYNTPAVRLLDQTGIDQSFAYLEHFHFQKIVEKDHILAAAVGGFTYGVSPLEITNAYTSFQDGTYQPARAILNVTDNEGNILYKWDDLQESVWSPSTVRKMRELLHEVVINGTGTRAYVPSFYIGGKSGTTNDVKDLWFVGLTKDYTTGVWVGHDKPKSMQNIQSQAPHMMIWKKINQ